MDPKGIKSMIIIHFISFRGSKGKIKAYIRKVQVMSMN